MSEPVEPVLSISPVPTPAEVAAIVGVLFSLGGRDDAPAAASHERTAWQSSARHFSRAVGPATSWRSSATAGWEST